MEVIEKRTEGIDTMAEKVFVEALNIAGGLRSLLQYRNLTWLPSLAEAAYVVVLNKEAHKTSAEIAAELGITQNTVRNIINSKEEEVEELLKGNREKVSEHIAGGLAKLAYRRLKGVSH